MDGIIFNSLPTLALVVCGVSAIKLTAVGFRYIAGYCDYQLATMPVGLKATGGFAEWRDIKQSIISYGSSPYLGTFAGPDKKGKGHALFCKFETSMLVWGSSGSGKTASVLIPCALSITDSKLILDFKSTLIVMLMKALIKQGQIVCAINIGAKNKDLIDPSVFVKYNILTHIIDSFQRQNGILDVESDVEDLVKAILPESEFSGENSDKFWLNGSRSLVETAILHIILVYGEDANLAKVHSLIESNDIFLKDMLWACGRLKDASGECLPKMDIESSPWVKNHDPAFVKSFIQSYRARAQETADILGMSDTKSNMTQSFLKTARDGMKPFSPNSVAYDALSDSTFRFADMKDGKKPMTVFIMIDSSKSSQQGRIASVLQHCCLIELKRAQSTTRPVYIFGEELTNNPIHNLPQLMTFGRENHILFILFLQSLGELKRIYKDQGVSTILSESQIKVFLPGIRDPDVLTMIEKMVGNKPYVATGHSTPYYGYKMNAQSHNEDARPVLTADEIRRSPFGISFIGHHKPVLTDFPSYAEIHPYRHHVAGNPMKGGKKWLLPVRLIIKSRKPSFLNRFYHFMTGGW